MSAGRGGGQRSQEEGYGGGWLLGLLREAGMLKGQGP